MKKNLLTLSILLLSIYSFAQDTFIGDKAIVKVESNTLFYNGGSLKLAPSSAQGAPSLTKIIDNNGNIIINNSYENSINNNNGQEFYNNYLGNKSYGQVIINNNGGSTTGKLTMEKKSVVSINNPNANSTTGIQQLPMSIPFKGEVQSIMNSFTGMSENNFRGNCLVDRSCNQRYWMTLYRWDNHKIVNDAVERGNVLVPGDYYLLNIITNTGLHSFYDGVNKIGYKGIAAPEKYTSNKTKTLIHNYSDEDEFRNEQYVDWKNKRNLYSEQYYTYLGNDANNYESSTYGKNMFRYGNPFTSNIDLRNPNNWLNVDGGIKKFEILKLAQDYVHSWNNSSGSSHNSTTGNQYVRANYDPNATPQWTGSAEAVLIRPLEMFRLTFDSQNLLNVGIELDNTEKTFIQEITGVAGLLRSENSPNFYQLKISLIDDNNNVVTEPVYLSTSNQFETGNVTHNVANSSMLLIEENNDGSTIANAKTIINTFNSEDYIAKPLHLELNNLAEGNQYKLKFNLKENNIFTEDVNNFNNYSFYIHDKIANTYTELNSNSEINIEVTNNLRDQYSFFWREIPRTLGVDDLTNKFKTQVYKFAQDQYKIKLNPNKISANIEIYHVNGSKVGAQSNISVNNSTDQLLNIPAGQNGLFIVKVIYNDGTQENLKLLVD